VGSLTNGAPDEITFCIYEDINLDEHTDCQVVVADSNQVVHNDKTIIQSQQQRLDFAKIQNKYFPYDGRNTSISPLSYVHPKSNIGNNVELGPFTYVGPHVTIGNNVKVQAQTSIGGEGFAYPRDENGEFVKQLHKGEVVIEDNVEIGSNTSIDRAVFDQTLIKNGTVIDNLVHVAHNVVIGENAWIVANTLIGGSVTIERNVDIHSSVTIADHINVGENAVIGMNSGVLNDVEPNTIVAGTPAEPIGNS
jgi:UDP-3-O-[3-hydroxymyristoyl] glucosamine N-acyltransferase